MELSELIDNVGEWESESSESAEARFRPLRRPSIAPSFRPRPSPNTPQFVTQAQLEAALARSDAKVRTVADGVSTIHTRLSATAAATRREVEERKKSVDVQSKDLNQKLQLMAMLPVLTKQTTAGPVKDANGVVIPEVLTPDTSSINKLLPLLLISGMGGSGGLGDTSGDSNSMMMMALVLALGN